MSEYSEKQQHIAELINDTMRLCGYDPADYCIDAHGDHKDQIVVSVTVKSDAV